METTRNNKPLIKEIKNTLSETEERIEAIESRLLNEKLCNAKFLQLFNERHALMVRRRHSLKKLQYARKGNPYGEAETIIN